MALEIYQSLKIAIDPLGIATVTLDRADVLNAVNALLHRELSTIFRDLATDPAVRVIVLTGAGRAFSAGGDIGWMQQMIDDPAEFERSAREGREILLSMLECEKPVLAKVNGHAIGLGASLALFADMDFAADIARIGDPHVLVGLTAADGGSVIWPSLIGHVRAKRYLLTGDTLKAPEAAAIGLINEAVSPDALDALVQGYAERLARGAQQAIRTTKAAVNIALRRDALATLDAAFASECLTNLSRDHQEAINAMREGRAPVFQ